jgi:branched-chain amino acid transport system permease protein
VFGSAALPALIPEIPSAYKDVFAFAIVIIVIAFKPTGLIAEKSSERV